MGALLTTSGHKRAQNLKHKDTSDLTSSPLVALGSPDTGNSWGGEGLFLHMDTWPSGS